MPLTAGTQLGPYEVIGLIGAGGMGEVYRARDTRLHRDVAVKVLTASLAEDSDRLNRFEREGRAVAALSHPNILAVYDVGHGELGPFVVTELLTGETLRERLARGPVAVRKATEYGVQIARGLAAAHDRGIVHRDLKPENLFVTSDGRVKILDFGIARLAPEPTALTASPTGASHTAPGAVLGTAGYMSPEQVRGEGVDHRSDVFSLGAVLYELLTGERAFRRDTAVETMTAILKDDPRESALANVAIPLALQQIVRRCLEKVPTERFQSAHDLAFALETVWTVPTSTAETRALPTRSRPGPPLAALLAAVLVVATVAAFVAGRRWTAAPPVPVRFEQLNFVDETIFNARFLPDGRTVIYSAAREGNTPELFVVRPDVPEPQPVGSPQTHLLAVSSRGELAVLTRARWINHRLFSGTLARMTLGSAPRELLENVREADWSPDGESLAVIRTTGANDQLEFPIGTVLYKSAGYLSDPRVSPTGDRVAVYDHPIRYDDRGSLVVVDQNRAVTSPLRDIPSLQGIAWLRGGKEIVVSMPDPGAATKLSLSQSWVVSLDGTRRPLPPSAGRLMTVDESAEGRWLTIREDDTLRVMVRAPGANKERDVSWLDQSIGPRLSGDGRHVAFSDQNAANYSVVLRTTEGSPMVRLGEGTPVGTGFSPDGQWVLALIPTPPQLAIYPTGAGEPVHPPREPLDAYDTATWFPDGRHILVCGNEAAHGPRCYRQQLPSGPLMPVTPEGTRSGMVSADGSQVIAQAADGSWTIYPLDGGAPSNAPVAPVERIVRWSKDPRALYVSTPGVPAYIERVDLDSGRREQIAEVGPLDRAGVLAVWPTGLSDDGRGYAYTYFRRLSRLFVVEVRP